MEKFVSSTEVEILPHRDCAPGELSPPITLDPFFESLIPKPVPAQLDQLEENLLAFGCRDALVVWRRVKPDGIIERILLDGHNRLSICKKQNLPYKIVEISLLDRLAAIIWIIHNQLGRRNLTPEAISYYRGVLYNAQKQQGQRSDLTSGQSDQKLETAEKLARLHQVGAKTIRRDGLFARHLNEIASVAGDQIRSSTLTRQIRLSKENVKKLAQLAQSNPDNLKQAFSLGKTGKEIVKLAFEKSSLVKERTFPYQVGDICWISAAKGEKIHFFNGYWGIVAKIYDGLNYCDFLFWKGVQLGMRAENLKPCQVSDGEGQMAVKLANRMAKIMDLEPEAMVVDMIQGISRRFPSEPTKLEEKLLSVVEKEYRIDCRDQN